MRCGHTRETLQNLSEGSPLRETCHYWGLKEPYEGSRRFPRSKSGGRALQLSLAFRLVFL